MAASTAAPATEYVVALADVQAARERIAPFLHKTPVLTSSSIDKIASAGAITPRHALFKCELFQKSGSFKARGATNAVMSLTPEEAAKGVCTHSSGNHAAALAMAAGMRGIKSYIVMPTDAPPVKRAAVEGYGGAVVPCEPNQKARETTSARVAAETGATFVHPSEDRRVIAGQGTIALELLEQAAEEKKALATAVKAVATAGTGSAAATADAASPSDDVDGPVLDAIIIPIGGGGMTSGMTVAIKGLDPRIKVIAAEPAAAGDAFKSKASGKIEGHDEPPKTIADGLKTTLGALPSLVTPSSGRPGDHSNRRHRDTRLPPPCTPSPLFVQAPPHSPSSATSSIPSCACRRLRSLRPCASSMSG